MDNRNILIPGFLILCCIQLSCEEELNLDKQNEIGITDGFCIQF